MDTFLRKWESVSMHLRLVSFKSYSSTQKIPEHNKISKKFWIETTAITANSKTFEKATFQYLNNGTYIWSQIPKMLNIFCVQETKKNKCNVTDSISYRFSFYSFLHVFRESYVKNFNKYLQTFHVNFRRRNEKKD